MTKKDICAEEFKYKQIFELSPEGIVIFDTKGKVLEANNRLYDWLKYEPEEIIGKNLINLPFLSRATKLEVAKKFAQRMLGKKILPYEVEFKDKNGDIKIGLIKAAPIRNDKGKIVQDFAMISNITERKEVENKLKESEERFQDIALSSADWIWETDENGKYVFVAGNVENILGYKPEELIGKTPFDLMPKKEAQRVGKIFKEIISKKKKIVNLENLNVSKDGKNIYLVTSGVPVLDEDKNLKGYRGIDRDVTKEKKFAQKLAEEEDRYKSLFMGSIDAIMILEPPTWNFTSGNQAAIDLFGAKDEKEFINLGPQDVSSENQPDGQSSAKKAKVNIAKAMKEGSNFFEWTHKKVNGEDFLATVLLSKIRVKDKDVIQATVRDVSEEKETSGRLQEKLEELEKMNKLMIGRELKMVKLKEEIEKLKNK